VKILHVIPAVAPRYGGPSSSIVSMCRALAAHGVEPTLVATDADGTGRLDVPLDEPTTWQGVNARFFARQFSEAFKYSRPLAAWLDRNVRDFSVVHVHGVLSHASLAAARAATKHDVPYIIRPLGTLDPWSLAQKSGRKRLLMRTGVTRLLRHASAIHYTSAEEQRSVERTLGLARGVVIPLGVDAAALAGEQLTDAARAPHRYVLALSRLHPVKNLEALVEAFADVHAGAAGWTLTIAGSGDDEYAATLREAVERRHVGDRVMLAGWVDGTAKQHLVGRASVFALPSFHENFGVSLVEAMAAGVPALVSRDVHLAEDINAAGAGWIVSPDRVAIAAGLREAMTDSDERAKKGQAASRLAARFAWPIVAGSLKALYERLTPRGSSEVEDETLGAGVSRA